MTDGQEGGLVWSYTLRNGSLISPVAIKVWVAPAGLDARAVLWAENRIMHTHHGQVTGTDWETTPLQPVADLALSDMTVRRNGSEEEGDALNTGEDGRCEFAAGDDGAMIEASLSGPVS